MNNKYIKNIATLIVGGSLLFGAAGCTDKFEDFNTDPAAPTPGQMEGDFASTGSLLSDMMTVVMLGQENDYQMINQMVGNEYGRMTSAKNQWGTGAYYATYDPPLGWIGNSFDTQMPRIYTSYFKVRDLSGGEGLTYHWAMLLRIFGTQRISDCYGPTPYTLIGGGDSFQVAYDDMPQLYEALFADLDVAIAGLKESMDSPTPQKLFGNVDFFYGGDIAKWVRFGNSLKLRMAMRLVNVNPTLAQQKAEEAVSDPAGLIDDASNAAISTFIPGGNSFWKTQIAWQEGRISADLTSYMNGYSDPRLPVYASPLPNKDKDEYVGARSGVYHYDNTAFLELSAPNVTDKDPLLAIPGCESWFARAEGALRGWNMGGTAKELYEKGIQVSMSERKVDIGDYLTSTATPANYVDPRGTYSINAVSTISPAYDESASFETNLERIMVQKWIGGYPNGWETWADFRRTGYPKWFPVVDNRSTSGVTSSRGMRRLPFPQSEFNTNEANVKAAQGMLGGPDTGATDLWWAKKN